MNILRLDNKWLIWPLFLFMMAYAVLRALFVEPLFDELATLYWYIQTGYLPGRGATMDANNHILNSLVSNGFFRLFGDHVIVYRLFALSTFPIYYFACRKFLLNTSGSFSFLVFLALVSVHWIFDYFSFSRGYGPSLAFLMLAFCFVQRWLKTFRTRYFAALTGCFILALLCNLSLLIPLFVLLCYLILVSIVRVKEISRKQLFGFWISTLLFLTFLVPVYIYINKLKKAGALWWGSTEGLWEVTGKSLSKTVLFSDADAWKYIFRVLLALLILILVWNWIQQGLRSISNDPAFWTTGLLVTTLLSFVVLAAWMQVNYPMDRVGMYLVPLFILSFGLSLQKIPMAQWSLLLLLWFPGSFVFHLNLDTSVFSPEDRIHRSFYEQIRETVPWNASISADYVSQASYAYLSRGEKTPHVAVNFLDADSSTRGDYHILWMGELSWPGYTCVLFDPVSKTRVYKRTTKWETKPILDTTVTIRNNKNGVIGIVDLDLTPYSGQQIRTTVEGSMSLKKYCLDLNLRHEITMGNGEIRRTDNTRFDWYFGRKTDYRFHYPNHLVSIQPEDRVLHLRLYNDDLNELVLAGIRVKIVTVTEKFR